MRREFLGSVCGRKKGGMPEKVVGSVVAQVVDTLLSEGARILTIAEEAQISLGASVKEDEGRAVKNLTV